jgi:hypothetical protein
MPIIETLEPSKPEELQHKIFATKKGEDYIIIQAVSEHVCFPSPLTTFPPLPSFTPRFLLHLSAPLLLTSIASQCAKQPTKGQSS